MTASEFDPWTWQEKVLGDVPRELAQIGNCAGVVMDDGDDGIITHHGFYYSIGRNETRRLTTPPYARNVQASNKITTFRGKMTVWGAARCTDCDSRCDNTAVWQYDHFADRWIDLGDLAQPRIGHEVVEVPVEYCSYF